jgi:hypothetical protein
LDQADQLLRQASEVDPNDELFRQLKALVDEWTQTSRRSPSLLLSKLPENATLVAYVDVKAIRKWPGLADVVNAWVESPELTGVTAQLRDTLKALGVRPLGIADSLCLWLSSDPWQGICCIGHTRFVWEDIRDTITDSISVRASSKNSINFGEYSLSCLGDGLIAWSSDELLEFIAKPAQSGSHSNGTDIASIWDVIEQKSSTAQVWLATVHPFAPPYNELLRTCGLQDSDLIEAILIKANVDERDFVMTMGIYLIEIADSEETAQRIRLRLEQMIEQQQSSKSPLHKQLIAFAKKITIVPGDQQVECHVRLPLDQLVAVLESFDNYRRQRR